MNDVDGYTCIKDLQPPKGVWRLEELQVSKPDQPLLKPDQPLVYSAKNDLTESFTTSMARYGLLGFRSRRVATFTPPVIWGGVAWVKPGSIVFTLPHARDTPSEYYMGWFEFQHSSSLIGEGHKIILDKQVFPRDYFRTEIVNAGSCIDVYCSLSLEECQTWLQRQEGQHYFLVDIPSVGRNKLRLEFPKCSTCYGAHRGVCPFLERLHGLEPMDVEDGSDEETMDVDSEVATDFMSAEQTLTRNRGPPRWNSTFKGPELQRQDLVDKIIAHVRLNKFILVSFHSDEYYYGDLTRSRSRHHRTQGNLSYWHISSKLSRTIPRRIL